MKDTKCLKCGKDLNNVSYADMMAHIQKHAAETIDQGKQSGLEEFS